MCTIRLAILAGVAAAACSASPVLTLLPGGSISGPPGSTIGWGYSITNDSAINWLQTLSLSAGAFSNLQPTAIFDFPAVAPGQTVTEPFSTTALTQNCTALPCGLYEVTIPAGVSAETVNGTFTIQADYYNGNPNTTGTDVGAAPDLTAAYSVAVRASAIPEPGTFAFLLAGFSVLLVRNRRNRRQL